MSTGIEFITRSSLNSLRHASVVSNYLRDTLNTQPTDDRHWSWGYLRRQFRVKNLEDLYFQYLQRLHYGYFSVFLLLQTILCVCHVTVLAIVDSLQNTLADVIIYICMMVLCYPIVLVVFRERLVQRYPCIPLVSSCLVIILLVLGDLSVTIYHAQLTPAVRPAYTTHVLLVCYLFLPLPHNPQTIILGTTVTVCHLIILGTVVYKDSDNIPRRLISDAVYMLCVNCLGLYFRLLNEVSVRRTFLDRRACLESTFKLQYEKQQEEHLLLSILPRHIIDVVREDIRRIIQMGPHLSRKKPFSDMYVKEHENVSILYADVVNYSKLTVWLPVNKLVETLNELFGRFDEASERHGVLRIKFLGDCYYCVSGIPESNPSHAKNCVELGLDMISIIREVREERKLKEDLDMRIGIHSGKVFSGLLGVCKWQYDVWSHDVSIANHMEQAGVPGKVHVTKKTLDLLRNEYHYTPGHGREKNKFLRKYNIETFFIERSGNTKNNVHTENNYNDRINYARRVSLGPQRRLTANNKIQVLRISSEATMAIGSSRRMVFMDNNLYRYQQTLRQADEQMEKAIQSMHVGVCDRWLFREKFINPLCLTFNNLSWEMPFIKQPDPLFKYYVGCALLIIIAMMFIQGLGLPSNHWIPWIGFGFSVSLLLSLIPLTWAHYIWNKLQDPHEEAECIAKPKNKLLKLLYRASLSVVWSSATRTVLYVVMCAILTVCAMLELVECDMDIENGKKTMNATTEPTDAMYVKWVSECLPSWHITETCALVIIVSFLFNRINFQLKFLIGCLIVGTYSWGIWWLNPEIFMHSETWNPTLSPQLAHVLSISFLTVALHLLDRQTEYMSRLDYKWKRQLSKEQEEGELTHMVNELLLENILPIHVAKLYLNTNRPLEQLYHEQYDTVAVMFASITGPVISDDDSQESASEMWNLKVLNQIVCDFDKLLFEPGFLKVEKIKMAGWTYMAACGLDPGRRESDISLYRDNYNSTDHVALILARFAAEMMNVLQSYNGKTFEFFRLRVGISHGGVTAAVVGASKPLYDIWGDSVNMASRMESTGEPGKIQVTEETAQVLQEQNVCCPKRGLTYVKGKGDMMTYFVGLDDQFKLIDMRDNETIDTKL